MPIQICKSTMKRNKPKPRLPFRYLVGLRLAYVKGEEKMAKVIERRNSVLVIRASGPLQGSATFLGSAKNTILTRKMLACHEMIEVRGLVLAAVQPQHLPGHHPMCAYTYQQGARPQCNCLQPPSHLLDFGQAPAAWHRAWANCRWTENHCIKGWGTPAQLFA